MDGLLGPDIVLASLAAWSASSFPGIPQCPGTHWIPTVQMQLANFVRRGSTAESTPSSALQRDWLSVIIRGRDDGVQCPAVIQSIASSMAEHSSSKELVNAAPFVRRVSKRGGSSLIMTTAAAPPCLKPLTADPSVKMVRSEFQRAMAASAADLMVAGLSDLFETPSRLEKMVTVPWCTHGGFLVRLISCLISASGGM